MRYLTRTVLALVACILVLGGAARAAEQVDLLLVLASDVSRSVDTRKFQLQREGYAAALSNPRVIDAIRSGPHGKIAICFVEWSGATSLKLVIDWTVVSDAASARKIGDQMLELPRSFADRTSISAGHRILDGAARARALSGDRAAPSMCRATAPTIPGATSTRCATRCSPRASPSTGW